LHIFSRTHGLCSKIDNMWGHKKNLYKLKKFVIISRTFTDHNDRKIKNQCMKICGNFTGMFVGYSSVSYRQMTKLKGTI
jgi:hypothetical protein